MVETVYISCKILSLFQYCGPILKSGLQNNNCNLGMAHFWKLKLTLASPLYEQKMKNITTMKRVAKGPRIGGISTQNGKYVGMENYNLPLIYLTKGCRSFQNWVNFKKITNQLLLY